MVTSDPESLSEGFLDDLNLIYRTDFGGRAAKRPVLDLKIIAGTAALSRGRRSGDTSTLVPMVRPPKIETLRNLVVPKSICK